MHTDVKLLLGWASVIVAGATAFYGWKVDFEQSKPLVWAGVIMCVFVIRDTSNLFTYSSLPFHSYTLLTTASTVYSFFVEKDIVFVGRRKTLAKRIETENITVSTNTVPVSASRTGGVVPKYRASVAYIRSSNGGKSLLGKGKVVEEKPFNEFFDEEGTMDQEAFERWVGNLTERVIDGQ